MQDIKCHTKEVSHFLFFTERRPLEALEALVGWFGRQNIGSSLKEMNPVRKPRPVSLGPEAVQGWKVTKGGSAR